MSSRRSMGVTSVISGALRGLFIAVATAGAAFGLLVVFHPFGTTIGTGGVVDAPTATVLHQRIDAARGALAQTKAALDNVKPRQPGAVTAGGQVEAQIAAATERRDLALRHAGAIRDALKSGLPVDSLAEIRDSVVIGQLMSQQSALEAQIAEQGAKFKPTHPVMRALNAQHTALVGQIRDEAASVASALESEAKLDDTQIKQLQGQSSDAPVTVATPAVDTTALEAQADAERSELDGLMDAYFGLKPGAAGAAASAADPLNPLNLVVMAVAGIAAILFQIVLAAGRKPPESELDDWSRDHAPELPVEPATAVPSPALRRAS